MMKNQEVGHQVVYAGDSPVPEGGRIIHQSGTVPEGAVFVSNDEILKMQGKIVGDWKPRKDMWPFTYGVGMIAGVTIATGAAYNTYYRKKLKLFQYNRGATLMASCVIPAITAVAIQTKWVMEPILLREIECPTCIATRAATAQMAVASIQTPILSYLSCSAVATMSFRYKLPSIKDPVAWLKKALSLTKPFSMTMLIIALINGWAATVIAYRQQKAAVLVHGKLLGQLEKQSSQETNEGEETEHSY